ncbi:type II secretion system protein GspL [Kosakonia sp. BYX6]|uniref:Type II secretion system protein L n=1 Tax=Kosakonia calanthes TaxID=3139408 RepID=A0ABZ3BAR4_9ENTR
MTPRHVARLHVRLPPLRELATREITLAWQPINGEWQTETVASLHEIAAGFQASRVEVCPHPADVSMTEIDIPPLRGSALHKAVRGAVELLALMPPEQLIIGYGERHDSGTLPVAWLSAAHLQALLAALTHAGLRIDALLPPPAFLPQPVADEASVARVDNWLVLRSGAASGAMLPFPHGAQDPESRLRDPFPAINAFHWVQASEEGEGWHWSFPLSRPRSDSRASEWLRPLVGWTLAAAVVWLGGLNLYAWRLQREGLALKQQMAEQVQATFPDVSVVLNPLQQARQLRDARISGNAQQNSADFPTLLRLAATLLSASDGQVAKVSYQQGQLDIRWREGAALRRAEVDALQQQAREHQVLVMSDAQGLHLRAGQEQSKPSP